MTDTAIVSAERLAVLSSSIQTRMRRSVEDILATGKDLCEARDLVEDGGWTRWLDALGISPRMAQHWMNVYRRFGECPVNFTLVAPSTLFMLAAPSTPESAITEVLGKLESGDKVLLAEAEDIVDKHKLAQAVPVVTRAIVSKAEESGERSAISYARSMDAVASEALTTGRVSPDGIPQWLTPEAFATAVVQETQRRQEEHIATTTSGEIVKVVSVYPGNPAKTLRSLHRALPYADLIALVRLLT